MSHRRPTAVYDCVPAFFSRSFAHFGHADIDVGTIARFLGTRVLEGDPNPWGLQTASHAHEAGVYLDQVRRRVPGLLQQVDSRLGFRTIAFNEVWGRMVDDVAVSALQRGCALGLGYNFARLSHASQLTRHVSWVLSADSMGLVLDDLLPGGPDQPIHLDWNSAWTAVSDIDGEYWVVGPSPAMAFEPAP